jgi:DNA-binding MarR family transcriptional regulator
MDIKAIRHFRRILRRFERLTNAQIKNCCSGVTLAQCLVLLEVEEQGRPTMGQLASQLRLDNSTLSRTVDGLVGNGMVERLRDDRDRRVVWIRLTPQGSALCRSIHDENDAHCRRAFEKIAPSKRKTVIRNFEVLVQAFLDCEAESRPGRCCDSATPQPATPTRRRSGHGARSP